MKILHIATLMPPDRAFGAPVWMALNLTRERYGVGNIANPVLDTYQRGGYRGYVTRARARA